MARWPRPASVDADPRRRAGLFHALRPVSFEAHPGRILGVVGPNGAGKTTLLRLLSTALVPSSGTASFEGTDIVRHPRALRRRLGFLSGTTGLYGRLTAREMITYFGGLHGLPAVDATRRADELLARFGMSEAASRPCDQLSAGMKQKVSIARTLVHDPDLVVLDEPTTGLDLSAARTILELVRQLKARGATVLLCTHHVHEVEALCDDLIVLRGGAACYQGCPHGLLEHTGRARLEEALLQVIDEGEVRDAA